MIPRRVWFAILIAFICHGFFILTARYRLSYDAFTHMLFADHYAKDWFSLWETRWYTGFDIVSYPPLTHQLIALFIPILGFEKSYALVLWVVTSLYPLGIYTFSRIFSGKTAASYASLASAVLLPIYITAHIFGQLPFLTATLFTLFSMAALTKFLREGGFSNFALAVSFTATTMAAHHATLLIQPFFMLALVIFQLTKNNWKNLFLRLTMYLAFAIPAGLIVIWPFWLWGMHQQMQIPIDHLSRHNYFTDSAAAAIFFFPFYFPIGAIIPFLFYKWPFKFLGLQFSFLVLLILGLGGTTPLPNLLFGKSWEWLTYDRFTFWATLTLTPFFGILFIHFRRWIKKRFTLKPIPVSLRGTFISASIFFIFACGALGSWFTPTLFPLQPTPIDMKPIVDFINAKDHYYWRYLTFGFGDQFAYLNLLTDKTSTLDGSYHTARTIPELRESGIGQIDTAYWAEKGIPAIGPILKVSGEYGVRWGFVNRKEYIPELRKNGWIYRQTLSNGIQVWENPKFTFKPPVIPTDDPFESFSWGVFPILSLVITLTLETINTWPLAGERIIRKGYSVVIGLLPLSFGFWYYKTILEFNHKQVYFTYDHALFFLSDGLALTAIILWLAVQIKKRNFPKLSILLKIFFSFCVWITLSAVWSADWRTSIYIAPHFWLAFLLLLSLQDWNETWKPALLGFCVALIFQTVIGIIEFFKQTTQFLEPLQLTWPGIIDASSKGASILKLSNGDTFLRVYGTFPHPNIFAGFILICIAGVTALILTSEKTHLINWALLIAGTSLLVITFSRSAWMGLIIFISVLLLKHKNLETKKVRLIFLLIALTTLLTLIPLRNLAFSRTVAPASPTEDFSITGRIWLAQQAWTYIKEKPITGLGAGSFIIQLANRSGQFNFVEPVHNIPLLVFSELGLVGIILLLAIIIILARRTVTSTNPKIILSGTLLAGMGTIALFDHYLWSLAPGRMMFALVLGLWQGQVTKDDNP
ncbi:MAG: O-antigen ligase family protein [Anaerolineales bacterium]